MSIPYQSGDLKYTLLHHCLAMADFADDAGKTPDPTLLAELERIANLLGTEPDPTPSLDDPETIARLTEIHNKLNDQIAPAKPRAVLAFLSKEEDRGDSILHFRANIPLIKRMRIVAVASLVGLITTSLSPHVDGLQESFNLTANHGVSLLLNYLFLLSAASMGACFSGMFAANRYIKEGTIDPMLESTYWSRYVLGLMGGIMIAMLIPLDLLFKSMGDDAGSGGEIPIHNLGAPMLALLGGFASNFAYVVLDKLVKLLESTVKPNPAEALAAKTHAARAQLADAAARDRLAHAEQLNKLQMAVAENGDVEHVRRELQNTQEKLMRMDSHTGL